MTVEITETIFTRAGDLPDEEVLFVKHHIQSNGDKLAPLPSCSDCPRNTLNNPKGPMFCSGVTSSGTGLCVVQADRNGVIPDISEQNFPCNQK